MKQNVQNQQQEAGEYVGREEALEIDMYVAATGHFAEMFRTEVKEVMEQHERDGVNLSNQQVTAEAMVNVYTRLEAWANFMRKDWETKL